MAAVQPRFARASQNEPLNVLPVPVAIATSRLRFRSAIAFSTAAFAPFWYSDGWPTRLQGSELRRQQIMEAIAPELQADVERLLKVGGRIPEEILGPSELRIAWSVASVPA